MLVNLKHKEHNDNLSYNVEEWIEAKSVVKIGNDIIIDNKQITLDNYKSICLNGQEIYFDKTIREEEIFAQNMQHAYEFYGGWGK